MSLNGLVVFFDKLFRTSTNEIYQPLQVIGVHFIDKEEDIVYIAIFDVKEIPICFTFSNVTFKKINALLSGSCLFEVPYSFKRNNISFVLKSIKAYNNGISKKNIVSATFLPASLFKFSDISL